MKRCREVNIRKFAPGKRPINNWPREFIFINYAGGFSRTFMRGYIGSDHEERNLTGIRGSMRSIFITGFD